MSVFTIGDLHLSFSSEKPMDIFKGWENHAERIEKAWNAVVKADDTVVVPGDISWAMSLEGAKEDFRFINSLNGTKIIGKGNHDYWWGTMNKMNAFLEENGFSSIHILHNNAYFADGIAIAGTRGWFYDDTAEFDKKVIAREAGRLKASLEAARLFGGETVVFLHYPPISASRRCEELLGVIKEYEVKYCFFGHLHGFVPNEDSLIESDGTVFRLVSADKLGFCPKLVCI